MFFSEVRRKQNDKKRQRETAKKLLRNGPETIKNNNKNIKNGKTTVHEPTHALEHLLKGFALAEQAEMGAKWVPDASRRLLDQKQKR